MAANQGIQKESIPRPRIQTLSDMIFGLALSIGAFSALETTPGTILGIFYTLISFGFSFLILSLVWIGYSRIMSVLPIENIRIVAANMVLLFLVSIEPYLFNSLKISAYAPSLGQLDSSSTTTLYALDLGCLLLVIAYFIHELTVEDRRLIPRELMKEYRLMMYTSIVGAFTFLVSALPVFWNVIVISSPTVPLRYVMWTGTFVANMGRRFDVLVTRRKGKATTSCESRTTVDEKREWAEANPI